MDAIEFLINQHRRIESLFGRYDKSGAKRRDVFGQIERAIIQHSVLEEMHVYPLLRERLPDGERLADHALKEHADVEQTLKKLGSLGEESAEFDTGMRQVIDSVTHHVREEEVEPGLLIKLRDVLTDDERDQLGRTLSAAADTTPTRAHPMAPDRPPGNKLLGLPVAIVDRIRDKIEGRTDTHLPPRARPKAKSRAKARTRTRTKAATKSGSRKRAKRAAPKRAAAARPSRTKVSRRRTRKPARARTKARKR